LEILRKMNKLFRGTYLSEPKVAHRSAHAADATTDARVLLQLDGELAGTLPAQFEVRPSSLKMR
jgi:diacylglycerol kinase family enzyme